MKKIIYYLLILLFANSYSVNAQLDSVIVPQTVDIATLGFGVGLDHGGFGANVTLYPQKNIGIFAGVGYAIADYGYNAGLKMRILSDYATMRFSPFFIGMYGYNAAIAVKNASKYNKLFYGTTFGLGFDLRPRPGKIGYWSFALLVPIRSPEVDDYIQDLKNNHNITFENDLLPIGISVGYRFMLQLR